MSGFVFEAKRHIHEHGVLKVEEAKIVDFMVYVDSSTILPADKAKLMDSLNEILKGTRNALDDVEYALEHRDVNAI